MRRLLSLFAAALVLAFAALPAFCCEAEAHACCGRKREQRQAEKAPCCEAAPAPVAAPVAAAPQPTLAPAVVLQAAALPWFAAPAVARAVLHRPGTPSLGPPLRLRI